jgi:DNA-directed RNA polymerase subunit L
MEVEILEEKKNHLVIEIEGKDLGFTEALKKELWNDSHVKSVGTHEKHPLSGKKTFVLETDGEDPKKVLKVAAKKLQKLLDTAKDSLKSVK